MAKSAKVKKHRSGEKFTKHNIMINKNPMLRQIRANLLTDFQILREEIIEECFKAIDKLKDDAEKKLVYDDSELISSCKELAKNNPNQFIPLLRTSLIRSEKSFFTVIDTFSDIRYSISSKELPTILNKAKILKNTSVIHTLLDFHNKILVNNIMILKHLFYEELDSTCIEYLKSYNIPNKESNKDDISSDIEENNKSININLKNKNMSLKKTLAISTEDKDNSENYKVFKMRSFKELNDLAIQNGFEFTRQRGDHAIFRNSNGYITVIPQRTIGKGLQIEILKQIGVC